MLFGIFRIVGNDLWPRDKKGSKYDIIKGINKIETNFHDCDKIWILNRLLDIELKSKIYNYLTCKNQKVIDIPFERNVFNKLNNLDKLKYLISVNVVRNFALGIGRKKYECSIILDGDCFFDIQQWQNFIYKFNDIKESNRIVNIFSFPVKRVLYKDGKIRLINNHLEEPQLAFCSPSKILFDEERLYGHRNKVALLEYLKFVRTSRFSNYYYPTSNSCLEVGEIYHLANSNFYLVKFGDLRRIARWLAIFLLKMKIKFGLV